MREIIQILESSGTDVRSRSAHLLPLVYDELRSLAASKLSKERGGQTLQATALVHEAWLRLGGDELRKWNDRSHFFRAAARAMRRILVDRARQKIAKKRGEAGAGTVDVEEVDPAAATEDERVLMIDDVLERLEREDPESARVVTLKFFGGLSNREVAAMRGVTERTVERRWAYAKARLFEMMRDEV